MDANTLVKNTRSRLRRHEGKYVEISQQSGISYSWLTKFAHGKADNPRLHSVQALQEALDEYERENPPAPHGAATHD